MTRIVITSVGSLVGQNILDSLQGRRDGIEVIGVNSVAGAASNFRCERAYLAPPAASSAAYVERLSEVLRLEAPDLVLAGRDDDVPVLALLKERQPQLASSLTVGPHRLAEVLGDKWESRNFAHRHGLPYVETAPATDTHAVEQLLARFGYPLLAKPRQGNGSRGVRIVFDEAQRAAVSADPEYLLQPYLEPEADLTSWRDLCRDGTPLFHAPTLQQIACQAVVGRDGRLRGLVSTLVELVMGRLERTWCLDDQGVDDIVRRYAETFAAEGWVGTLNLQGRRDDGGTFNVYELNGRLTGGTTARLLLGFDEVGLMLDAFTGHRLPPRKSVGPQGIVTKSLTEFVMQPADIHRLQAHGVWQCDTGANPAR